MEHSTGVCIVVTLRGVLVFPRGLNVTTFVLRSVRGGRRGTLAASVVHWNVCVGGPSAETVERVAVCTVAGRVKLPGEFNSLRRYGISFAKSCSESQSDRDFFLCEASFPCGSNLEEHQRDGDIYSARTPAIIEGLASHQVLLMDDLAPMLTMLENGHERGERERAPHILRPGRTRRVIVFSFQAAIVRSLISSLKVHGPQVARSL